MIIYFCLWCETGRKPDHEPKNLNQTWYEPGQQKKKLKTKINNNNIMWKPQLKKIPN